jgi:Rrf2 family protein
MRIGRAAAYAVVALSTIAARSAGGNGSPAGSSSQTTKASDIARRTGVPVEYLRKILQRLTRARLVRSERGRGGGFRLARPGNRITLLQVVEAIEGPVDDIAIFDDVALHISDEPTLRNLRRWRHSTAGRMRDILGRTTLNDIILKREHAKAS